MAPSTQHRVLTRLLVVFVGVAAVLGTLTVVPGCNTTEGAGKDVKSLGKGIEDSARDAKN